ncbi:MAG TPA: SDR family oxidoreductase [Bauldia sp.]|nr:SDR family oxidoreductase [Bauldia sp.]
MADFSGATIGVTGANGNLGRHVIQYLRAGGAKKIVGFTRNPDKAADLAAAGVELRRADFSDAAHLGGQLAGVERLLVISTDTLVGRAELQSGAVDAAVKAGVSHIMYNGITSPYPDADPSAIIPNSHYWTEVRIAASGVDFSFLRNNLYTDYQIPAAKQAIASGALYHASGRGRRALVTREDCAAAAAAALLSAKGKQVFDIGGPEALSADEIAALLSEISGKPVKAVNIPPDALIQGMVQAGMPAEFGGVMARFDVDAGKGHLAVVSGDVEKLTGRKPRSLADFLKAHRGAIVG